MINLEDDSLAHSHILDVYREFLSATEKFGSFNSTHEGYAVILEELDEMWDAIKANDIMHALEEAKQVAAMALRFMYDLGAK